MEIFVEENSGNPKDALLGSGSPSRKKKFSNSCGASRCLCSGGSNATECEQADLQPVPVRSETPPFASRVGSCESCSTSQNGSVDLLPSVSEKEDSQAQKTRHVEAQIVPEAEHVQTQIVPEAEHFQTQIVPEAEHVQTQIVPETEHVEAQIVPEAEHVETQIVKEAEHVEAQIVSETEHVQAQIVSQDEHVETQIVSQDEHIEAQVVPETEHVEAQVVPETEHVEAQIVPDDEHVQTQIVSAAEQVQAQIVPDDEHVQTQIVPDDEHIQTQIVPDDEHVQAQIVSGAEHAPAQADQGDVRPEGQSILCSKVGNQASRRHLWLDPSQMAMIQSRKRDTEEAKWRRIQTEGGFNEHDEQTTVLTHTSEHVPIHPGSSRLSTRHAHYEVHTQSEEERNTDLTGPSNTPVPDLRLSLEPTPSRRTADGIECLDNDGISSDKSDDKLSSGNVLSRTNAHSMTSQSGDNPGRPGARTRTSSDVTTSSVGTNDSVFLSVRDSEHVDAREDSVFLTNDEDAADRTPHLAANRRPPHEGRGVPRRRSTLRAAISLAHLPNEEARRVLNEQFRLAAQLNHLRYGFRLHATDSAGSLSQVSTPQGDEGWQEGGRPTAGTDSQLFFECEEDLRYRHDWLYVGSVSTCSGSSAGSLTSHTELDAA